MCRGNAHLHFSLVGLTEGSPPLLGSLRFQLPLLYVFDIKVGEQRAEVAEDGVINPVKTEHSKKVVSEMWRKQEWETCKNCSEVQEIAGAVLTL